MVNYNQVMKLKKIIINEQEKATCHVEEYMVLNQRRDGYVQSIVKTYIASHLNDDHDLEYDAEQIKAERASEFYDKKFRENVVNAMLKLHVSQKNIETALESTRDLWLPETRRKAFDNLKQGFTPDEARLLNAKYPTVMYRLSNLEKLLFEHWNQLRDYEYYQEHCETIKSLGMKHPAQNMTVKDKNEVMQIVSNLGFSYKQQLEKCRQLLNKLISDSQAEKSLNQ